jgi:hypothetical protein
MQYLLDETSKGLLIFLNAEINRLPAAIQRDILNQIPNAGVIQADNGKQIKSGCDVYVLLGIFWRNWDILEKKVLDPADIDILGRVYRSYISILIQARNEWAHINSLTYEDVIFYGLTAKRFFSSKKTDSVASVLEEIVEESFQKLLPEKPIEVPTSTGPPVTPTEAAAESEKPVVNEIPQPETIKRLKKDDHEKVVDVLLDIVRNGKYEDLAKLVDYPLEITLPDPKFPNTFCLSDERNTFAFGMSKFELIKENLVFVTIFALTGKTLPTMAGEFKGNPTICLPSNSETNLQIGQVKAQMICMKMHEISEWLNKTNQK